MTSGILDRVYGCIIGGAIGDALGAPVQGWAFEEIREKRGRVDEFGWYDSTISDGSPGSVTGDTVLRHYLALAIIESGGRVTPDEVAKIWREHMDSDRVWVNEEIIYLKLQINMNPWDAGRGTMETANAAMGIAPVGIINAGDPRQAYQDAFNVASLNQDGVGRDAAATIAAGIAAAFNPDAAISDVLQMMTEHSTGPVQRAIDLTLAEARESDSIDDFVGSFYDDMLDWRSVIDWDRERFREGKHHSTSPLEIVPAVMGLLELCDGKPNKSIIEGASFGRQSDAIAGLIGNITGSLHGANALQDDWIETCEEANEGLIKTIEENDNANFKRLARRMVEALEKEHETITERKEMLGRLLEI